MDVTSTVRKLYAGFLALWCRIPEADRVSAGDLVGGSHTTHVKVVSTPTVNPQALELRQLAFMIRFVHCIYSHRDKVETGMTLGHRYEYCFLLLKQVSQEGPT